MNKPLISIIVPTYNRSSLIKKTIESALNQSFENFEIIIVDDGSTDNTKSVVESLHDPRVIYYAKKNEERARARNFGLEKSNGDYVTFLDSDDLIYTNHLEVALEEITKNTPVFWSPYEEIDQSGTLIRNHQKLKGKTIDLLINKGNFMSCHGVFIQRAILEKNKFNEDRSLSGSEDIELWLRIGSKFDIIRLAKVTNALVHHNERSVFNFDNINSLVERKELMIKYISEDNDFMQNQGHRLNRIKSQTFSYIALHAAMNPNNPISYAYKYMWKAFKSNSIYIFERRTLATIKHCLLRFINRK